MKVFALFRFSLNRLLHARSTTLLTLLAYALMCCLVVATPVFSDAVSRALVEDELSRKAKTYNRAVFSVRLFGSPSSVEPLTREHALQSRDWVQNSLEQEVGLPIGQVLEEYMSFYYMLRPLSGDSRYGDADLGPVRVASRADFTENITIVEGQSFGEISSSGRMSVWVLPEFAETRGIQVGELYHLYDAASEESQPLEIEIAGFWRPKDSDSKFWYWNPEAHFEAVMVVTMEQYWSRVASGMSVGTQSSLFCYVIDESRLNLGRADEYIPGLESVERDVNERLVQPRMDLVTPATLLETASRRKIILTVVLLCLELPAIVMIALFMISVSRLVVHEQEREVAMLASRGMTRSQFLTTATIEAGVLAFLSIPIGLALGVGVSAVLGHTLTFMQLRSDSPLTINLTAIDWRPLLLVSVANVGFRLAPALRRSQATIVSHERGRARRSWGNTVLRMLLMLVLLAATYYAYDQLSKRGTLGLTGWLDADQPTTDIVLLLGPSMFLVSGTLVALYCLRIVMVPVGRAVSWLPCFAPYIGISTLSREGPRYRIPVFLLVLCLGLGVFYASLATSADRWLTQRLEYEVGADLTFDHATEPPSMRGSGTQDSPTSSGSGLVTEGWLLPASEYEKIEGVSAATQVRDYAGTIALSNARAEVRVLGIDRLDFAEVAYYRREYAEKALGELLNRLGSNPEGILMSRGLSDELGLTQGDTVPVNLSVEGYLAVLSLELVGTFDYFPTMYEPESSLVLVNGSHLDQVLGGLFPHSVWLKLQPGIDPDNVLQVIEDRPIYVEHTRILAEMLGRDQARPERTGVFGILSLSFLLAAVMAALGLALYDATVMDERSWRFAVLRAMGMRRGQVNGAVAVESMIVVGYSVVIGLFLGALATRLYVGFFPFGPNTGVPIPPFTALIDWGGAWRITAGVLLALGFTRGLSMIQVARQGMFEALRLGTQD